MSGPLPLRLPLETIERILFYAFDAHLPLATPFTCLAPLTPAASTAHLLLVSKGITAIALPLYWKSVTILKSTDWVALWGVETGLFTGERGRDRASWVKEIRLNVHLEAAIPFDLNLLEEAFHDDNFCDYDRSMGPTASDLLAKLETVPLPALRHMCFFRAEVDQEDDDGKGSEDGKSDEATSLWGSVSDRSSSRSPSRAVKEFGANLKRRFTGSADAWEDAAESLWDNSADDRWEAYLENSWCDTDDSENEEDDEDERGDPGRDAWWKKDADEFVSAQAGRETDLALMRLRVMRRLFGRNKGKHDASVIAIEARVLLDQYALWVMYHVGLTSPWGEQTQMCERIAVYVGASGLDWGRELPVEWFDERLAYDFVGLEQEEGEREKLMRMFEKRRYKKEVIGRWRWVEEDGTTTPLVG